MQKMQLILATSFRYKTYSHRLSHLLVVWSLINDLQVFHLQIIKSLHCQSACILCWSVYWKNPNSAIYLHLSQEPLWPTGFLMKIPVGTKVNYQAQKFFWEMFLTLMVEALIYIGVRRMRIPARLSETAFFSFSPGMKGQDKVNTAEIINICCPQDCEIVLLCPNSVATHEYWKVQNDFSS